MSVDLGIVVLAMAAFYAVCHFSLYAYRSKKPGALFPDGLAERTPVDHRVLQAVARVSLDRRAPAVILPIDFTRRQMATSRKGRDVC